MNSPFHIFSWQQPFLPALKQATDLWSDGRPGDAVIIVPHNRPWRYLVDIYAAAGTTGLLPKVLSLPDMVRLWRMHASPVPLRTACLLDRVALLRDCVLDLADEDHEQNASANCPRMPSCPGAYVWPICWKNCWARTWSRTTCPSSTR